MATIAVVTGASRGAGRAIAAALGEGGATVYVTGRSTRSGSTTENLPGTIEDAAEEVDQRGGSGIPVRCDHTSDGDIKALFDQVTKDHGRLDLLVNNAWGGYEAYGSDFDAPFWEQPLSRWDRMFNAGVRTHFVTTRAALPLLRSAAAGGDDRDGVPPLVISTVAWSYGAYLGNLIYDTAKAAIIRMAFGMAQELMNEGIAVVALVPGFMRTERVLLAHEQSPFDLSPTESPEYLGRAVAALAADKTILERSGQLLVVGELARLYGFTDVDGRQPEPFRIPE